MLGGALFGKFKNVGELGIIGEHILATAFMLFNGVVCWGITAAHRRAFIRRVEEGLKLRPVKEHRPNS